MMSSNLLQMEYIIPYPFPARISWVSRDLLAGQRERVMVNGGSTEQMGRTRCLDVTLQQTMMQTWERRERNTV